jgi:hypothetical protein
MKQKLSIFWVFVFLVSIANSYCQENRTIGLREQDSIRKVIGEIIDVHQKSDSLYAFAMVYALDMPEDWYALFRIDTIKGELIWANSYVYQDKFKYLTKYAFYKNKLIATQTSKSKIKNQSSIKYIDWDSNFLYWNDSLVYSHTTKNEPFDFRKDIKIASELMECFRRNYSTKKLYFDKGSNIGKFR